MRASEGWDTKVRYSKFFILPRVGVRVRLEVLVVGNRRNAPEPTLFFPGGAKTDCSVLPFAFG